MNNQARRTVLVVALALFSLAGLGRAQQVVESDAIVDHDFSFRLEKRDDTWRLLGEEDVRKIVPDALAGGTSLGGVWGAIIAETAFTSDVKEYAEVLLSGMELENKVVELSEPVTFGGRNAYRTVVRGTTAGIDFRFRNTVYMKDGWAFQVLSWGVAQASNATALTFFESKYTILPDEARGRTMQTETIDTNGVGWRMLGGVFESAALRMAAEPRGDWRVVVGAELMGMSSSAEVGLVHTNPEIYVIVIAEPVAGADRKAFRQSMLDDAKLGATEAAPKTLSVMGGEREFLDLHTEETLPLDWLYGVFFVDDFCFQVRTWHTSRISKEEAGEYIRDGLAGLRVLESEDLARLERDLDAMPDSQNRVGTTYSLRRGIYRDFASNLTWTKPEGYWRVLVGEEARAENEDATLHLEEPALGIFGLLIIEPSFGVEDLDFHRLIQENTFGADHAIMGEEPRAVTLGKEKGLTSVANLDFGAYEIEYHVVTVTNEAVAVQLLLYGLPGNLAAASGSVNAAIAGLRFTDLEPVTETEQRYRDERLGFEFRPPSSDWRRSDRTPEPLRSVSSFMAWTNEDDATIQVMTICALGEGQDEVWFQELVETMARGNLERLDEEIRDSSPTTGRGTLAGLPCRVLRWEPASGTIDILHLLRDRTFYGVLIAGPSEADLDVSAIAKGLRLLD